MYNFINHEDHEEIIKVLKTPFRALRALRGKIYLWVSPSRRLYEPCLFPENKIHMKCGRTLNDRRPLQNAPFCPISASGSDFNPRNIQHIPVVKILAFLDLGQISADFEIEHFSKVS